MNFLLNSVITKHRAVHKVITKSILPTDDNTYHHDSNSSYQSRSKGAISSYYSTSWHEAISLLNKALIASSWFLCSLTSVFWPLSLHSIEIIRLASPNFFPRLLISCSHPKVSYLKWLTSSKRFLFCFKTRFKDDFFNPLFFFSLRASIVILFL